MRNIEEIKEYLGLDESCKDFEWYDEVLETASFIEKKYETQISSGIFGYGLLCDFEITPFLLEDCEIQKVEEINGIVVYRKIEEQRYE